MLLGPHGLQVPPEVLDEHHRHDVSPWHFVRAGLTGRLSLKSLSAELLRKRKKRAASGTSSGKRQQRHVLHDALRGMSQCHDLGFKEGRVIRVAKDCLFSANFRAPSTHSARGFTLVTRGRTRRREML